MIRRVDAGDVEFLRAMVFEAAHWRNDVPPPPFEEALARPELARYVDGWGRPGDAGVVAVEAGRRVGAAWYRLFTAARPGYGFVGERTPELSIGVRAEARGRGVGTALAQALLDQARRDGFQAISLSVEPDNPALRLYERLGFVRIGGVDAWTMLAEL